MKTIQVGYRRLYDSLGCSVTNQETIHVAFPFGEHLQVEIYMGNKPKLGIWTETDHEDYMVVGQQTTLGAYTYQTDATKSAYPRTFFTEIICSQEVEISDELFEAFYREEPQIFQELVSRAEAHTNECKIVLDLLSGVLGLRFHPQFIMKLLNDGPIAFHGEKRIVNQAGSAIMILEPVQINDIGKTIIDQLFPAIGTIGSEEAEKASQVLEWLIRAWAERDIISKFNALFIPLEMILEGIEGVMPKEQQEQVQKIYTLISTCNEEDREKEALNKLLDRLVKTLKPSLRDRFIVFAEQAKMTGYKNDIKAFSKFNGIRNGLLHRGESNVRIHVTIGENEVLALEDLTERYINYYLFKDTNVYQSSYQHRPTVSV